MKQKCCASTAPWGAACLALAFMASYASTASAAIVALRADDSVGGFTTSTPELPDTFGHNNPPASASDGKWGHAADPSNGQSQHGGANAETSNLFNYVWTSRADLGEDNPQVNIEVSGLDSTKPYNLYMYHVTREEGLFDWGLQAGIGSIMGSFTLGAGTYLEDNGSSTFERVLLGTVSGVSSATIVLDDLASDRGYIKGVGVEEVIPEPSSCLLVILGGLVVGSTVREPEPKRSKRCQEPF